MRLILLILSLLIFQTIQAQDLSATEDVLIVAEQMPRFPGCETMGLAEDELKKCSEQKMLEYVYQNIKYPEEAIKNNVEGNVVIRFIIEKDGSVSNGQIIKDIGDACGQAALNMLEGMNELEEKWIPGQQNGVAVRTYFNLPVKFQIEKPQEYYIDGRDTVWIKYDTAPVFEGGIENLNQFLQDKLVYPEAGNDSCLIGVMDCSALVRSNGQVVVLNINDYNDLGIDYQFAATRAITASMFKWQPAIYNGKQVSTGYNIRLTLSPTSEACKNRINQFEESYEFANEGIQLYEEKKVDEAIVAYSKALELFPQNAEFLLLRGQALFETERIEEACIDLKEVKRRLIDNVYNKLLPIVCLEKTKEEGEE